MAINKTNARRREVRRNIGKKDARWWRRFMRPDLGWALVYVATLSLVGGMLVWHAQQREQHHVGERVSDAIVARVGFEAVNEDMTRQQRDEARQSAPSIYAPNQHYFADLRSKLQTLGKIGADQGNTKFEQLDEATTKQLHLTPQAFAELRLVAADRKGPEWADRVEDFIKRFQHVAVLTPERFKIERDLDKRSKQLVIQVGSNKVWREFLDLHNAEEKESKRLVDDIVDAAGVFKQQDLIRSIALISLADLEPTVSYDDVRTKATGDAAAASVESVIDVIEANQVLFKPGQVLTSRDLRLLARERELYEAELGALRVWLQRFGSLGVVMLIAVGLWGYIWIYNHRVAENPMRGLSITALIVLCLGAAVFGTGLSPDLEIPHAAFPTLLIAIVLAIAYDQRFSLAASFMYTLMLTFTLQLPIGFMLLLLTAVAVAVLQLPDVRTRSKLVWVGIWTGLAMGGVAALVGVVEGPMHVNDQLKHILVDAALAMGTGVICGMFVQGMLPAIEKMFRVTTSMTLKELNDASHPLLRRLAQEAPGTYQHSLRIADMAEAAAQQIGANSLLCKVGAMYHDIGKSNKPQYFVENQGGGPNRHDKLSPAMSLLIIVGHVKDGVEMAREYHLPREVIHFIESHHGTTLVEYFYHAAKKKSDQQDMVAPDEFDFRYPGPKPQNRESAILMLCDAVESASRTIDEPTAVRLEQLVHKMASKRLNDGQFDECHITLKELHQIEAAITKVLCAVYHGRIKYPEQSDQDRFPATAGGIASAAS